MAKKMPFGHATPLPIKYISLHGRIVLEIETMRNNPNLVDLGHDCMSVDKALSPLFRLPQPQRKPN
jgi:hypothetical protein